MGPASSIADMFSRPRISAVGMLLAFASLGGASSCLYHSSDRCDPGQTYNSEAGLCVCDEKQNLIAGDHGCIACGDNASAKDDGCHCDEGYTGDGFTCKLTPAAQGITCKTNADCQDKVYDTCHLSGDSGYCTNTGCTAVDDPACTGGYACDLSASPAYCVRPPDGAGNACKSNDDCMGTEATYCETFNAHSCFVQGCSLTDNDCFPGKDCCDLSTLSGGIVKAVICVDAGTCKKK